MRYVIIIAIYMNTTKKYKMENRMKISCTLCRKIKGDARNKIENLTHLILEKDVHNVNMKINQDSKNFASNLSYDYRQNIPKHLIPFRNKTVQKFSEFFFTLPQYSHNIYLQIINIFDYFNSFVHENASFDEKIIVAMFVTIQTESISIYDGYDNIFSFYPELNQAYKITELKNIQYNLLNYLNCFYPNDVFCDFVLYIIDEYFRNLSFLQKKKKGTPFTKNQENTCYFKNLSFVLSIKLYEEILKNIDEKSMKLPQMTLYIGIFWTILNYLNCNYNTEHLNLTVFFKLLEDLNIKYIDEMIEFSNFLLSKDYKF